MRTSGEVARERLPGATTYLVEHYWPGITADAFRAASQRVRTTAEIMSHAGTPVHCLHSIMVPVDESAICMIDAPSRESIEQLYARAGVRFDRIVTALEA